MADPIDIQPEDIQERPPWRHALRLFLETKFAFGDVVPHEWFYHAFDIEMPTDDMTCKKADVLKLARLTQFEKLQDALLNDHQIDLSRKPGHGYVVVPPKEQSSLAYSQGMHDIRHAMRKMCNRVANVNHGLLTAEERKENADTLARVAAFANMAKQVKRLPRPSKMMGE